MRPSFNGDIPEIPGIAIDNFENSKKRAYFLSHCHADHTSGLDSLSFRVSPTVSIYMSEPSAAIVETYIDENLMSYIKPLKLGSTTITIPGDEENDVEELFVRVTLIPAGHCFGSVMFLFETPLKKVLYTGDFRVSENSVSKMAQLHGADGKPIKLDVLYVDTTFQHCTYETFPKRSEVIDGVVQEIKTWLKQSDEHRIALITSARYGYEKIFNDIYKRLSMKVYAGNNWTLYSKFPDKLVGVTNNKDSTKIHLCSKSSKFCDCHKDTQHIYRYINFSAMKWQRFDPEDLTVTKVFRNNGYSVDVCFATHCSRSELVYFVEYLAPKKVVGFSEPYNAVKEPGEVINTPKRSSEKKSDGEKEDKRRKVPKSVLRNIFG